MSIFDEDRVSIIPIASFEGHFEDGELVFRRTDVKFRNEQAFTDAVVQLFTMAGWRVHHDRMKQNVQGHAGFPDIVAVRRGRVVFAELKMPGKEPEVEQQNWLDHLLQPLGDNMVSWPITVACWHPSDWERIVAIATAR